MHIKEETPPANRQRLFAVLLPRLEVLEPALAHQLIHSGNKDLSTAASEAVYHTLQVDVILPGGDYSPNTPEVQRNRAKLETVIKHPHLAGHVRTITFSHPPPSWTQKYRNVEAPERDSERMQVWSLAALLLGLCNKVQSLDWKICYGIQGELWTAIASATTLRTLSLDHPNLDDYPSITSTSTTFARLSPELQAIEAAHESTLYSTATAGECKSWTLGAGWQNLEKLKLAGLSQNGAKTLCSHLQLLTTALPVDGGARLVSLDLSTHFLDVSLLTSIGEYGALGSLKHLTLSTTGTRLTADGIQVALEGCTALESFTLKDGEGRLDKTTWAQIDSWPPTLRSLTIEIAESGSHHSWVLHHLASIHHIPFHQLETFRVKRIVHPNGLLPFPTVTIIVPGVQKGHELEAVPPALLEAIMEGEEGCKMRDLCLDWWEMGPNELDALVKSCTGLKKLQVGVSFALVKLVTMMQPTFASACEMEEMILSSQPKYNIGNVPTKSKIDITDLDLPLLLADKLREPDPSIPDSKHLRKFVRRMPRLRRIKWTGRGGKGEWTFSKKTTLVNVCFTHAAVSLLDTWWKSQLDPPFFEYEEPEPTSRTILEIGSPTSTASGTGVTSGAEYPALSLSRSSTSSSFRMPQTPSSPATSRSFSAQDISSKLDALAIMPEVENEYEFDHERNYPPLSAGGTGHGARHARRSSTLDSSTSTRSDLASPVALARRTSDMARSTKRLTIGGDSSIRTEKTVQMGVPMVKTVSAPARSGGSKVNGNGHGHGREGTEKSGKGRNGPRQSK